jgi:hypothetical protein
MHETGALLHCKINLDFIVQCNIYLQHAVRTAVVAGEKGQGAMVKNIDEVQKLGKDSVEASLKSWGALSRGVQAITVELADYSKKAFEQGTAATEKLFGAKSLDKAMEVQSEYVRSAYEGLVAEATKLGELYSDVAREAYKPFENQFGRIVPAN